MISSKWLLGYAAQLRPNGEGEWYDTFIGGEAIWPEHLKVTVPPCPLCNAPRTLVVQAFAPQNAHSEREIYLFGCNSIKCASNEKSWFAARVCKEVRTRTDGVDCTQLCEGSQENVDCTETDDREDIKWDTDSDSDDTTASDLVAHLEALSLQVQHAKDKHAPDSRPPDSTATEPGNNRTAKELGSTRLAAVGSNCPSQPDHDGEVSGILKEQCLDSYYVEVGEEPAQTNPAVDDNEVTRLLRNYEKEEKTLVASGASELWGVEIEEQDSAASHNFEVFQDRISLAPEQILRYRFDSEPIWPKYPAPSLGSAAKCECGSPLVFEVQVLGSSLHYLHPDKSVAPHQKEAGMNFAAAAIYTCRVDCTNSEMIAYSPSFKVFRQAVLVQKDEW